MCLALTTCSNPEVTTLLKAPSELVSLEIVAYAGDVQLEGGAAMEPGFTSSVFTYTVFVSKDTDRFTVNAAIKGKGTIDVMCEEDQETGNDFDYLDDYPKIMILTVERQYMETAEYRVTVVRAEAVPTATGVEIQITPAIGAFFVGRGVIPEFQVTANLPAAGGELSYQWYMNTSDSNRGGTRINGATGTTYRMRQPETMIARTMYYYAEITNTLDGKTGVTESLPCRVVFLDINALDEKSRTMVNIPAGTVSNSISAWEDSRLEKPWSTPGFSMGKYLVTWELWKLVADYADAGGYRFANSGTQGWWWHNYYKPAPAGNDLNPAANVNFRDIVVWCNAYSEMDGREPVYVDSDGNVLRDSRVVVEELIDETKMTGKNGYRLPTHEEWYYAMKGANPSTSPPWTDRYPGTDDLNELDQYMQTDGDVSKEVGTLLPNSIGLFDMIGLGNTVLLRGRDHGFAFVYSNAINLSWYFFDYSAIFDVYYHDFYTLRLARNKE
jgi:formylglycine-generating enzyme required for sulfatase activity